MILWGTAIKDFKRPDRTVVGTNDDRAFAVMNEIYRPLFLNAALMLSMDRRNAELTKYAGSVFLAVKITYINEMARRLSDGLRGKRPVSRCFAPSIWRH